MYTDLHIHTTRSDGTFTPRTLLKELERRQVTVFSVTDHNRMPQIKLLTRMANAKGLCYLPGCEVDCLFEGHDIHILAYGFTPTPALTKLVRQAREQLLQMSVDLLAILAKEDARISLADYALFEDDPAMGGWKGIRYLVKKGVCATLPEAMALYPKHDILYEKYPFPKVEALCKAVHKAGGVTVLAHPGAIFMGKLQKKDLKATLQRLIALGVDGVECYHPRNDQELVTFLNDFCNKHNLYRTAGSDCHGGFQRVYKGVAYAVGHPQVQKEALYLPPLPPPDSNK